MVKSCSMALKSERWDGTYKSRAPIASVTSRTPVTFQIRCTARDEIPTARATALPVQWVTSPGSSEQVSAKTSATVSVKWGGVPGERVLSRSRPSTPASA